MKALACTCKDCSHWEILDKSARGVIGGRNFVGQPWTQPITLKCKTCGHEFDAEFGVSPHEKLTEVEVKP